MSKLRYAVLLFVPCATACATGTSPDDTPAAPPIAGVWSAPVLEYLDPSKASQQTVDDAAVLTLGKARTPQQGVGPKTWDFHGKASLVVKVFYDTGTTNVTGNSVQQLAGTATYAATWSVTDYSPQNPSENNSISMTLECQSVDVTDSAAPAFLCGQNGLASEVNLTCDLIEGSAVLPCHADGQTGVITFAKAPSGSQAT